MNRIARGSLASAAAVAALAVASVCQGSMAIFKALDIDFTNVKDVEAKASWSPAEKLSITKQGLGWDGEGASSHDGWIQTKAMAVGLWWRPAQAVNVRVAIVPPPTEVVLNSGQKHTSDSGDVYVRYSPDMKHWSSWQVLQRAEPRSVTEKKTPGRYYDGQIRVPYRDSNEYRALVYEYAKLDVPWKSDEEAAVRWILGRNPNFFARNVPFIGYLEFLFEGGFHGGQRFRSLRAEVSCGIGGIHYLPKDKDAHRDRDPSLWRFEASGLGQKEPRKSRSRIPWLPPPAPPANPQA